METIDELRKKEAKLKSEMENSLQLASYEERRAVDAKGHDKKVSEIMSTKHYQDAEDTKEKMFEVRRKIKELGF